MPLPEERRENTEQAEPNQTHNLPLVPYSLWIIVVVFTFFFWPAVFAGRYFVSGDALVYAYPLRLVAWETIRHGTLPLWIPNILSGYPLLAMAQLGLGYPLTWGYLFLSGHAAEQVYVLAPFLLAPAFIYGFLRAVDRSRLASLFGGLSFAYGGMMAGGMAHNGMFNNAVMWLPLMLIAIERSRTHRFLLSLLGVAVAYALSILTGLGQGFLYAGIIALGYSAFLSMISDRERWKPLSVCVCGILLAVGLTAFQILETVSAQRMSIRRELTYEIFSGGSLTPKAFWESFMAPIYHFNYEMTAFLPLLTAVMAPAAVIAALRAPRESARVFFWLSAAVLAAMLMMGGHTPLYRLIYHIPVVNLFRIPWRHAFEWTFAVSMLAAYGWDAMEKLITPAQRSDKLIGLVLLISVPGAGLALWKLMSRPIVKDAALWPIGFSEASFLILKFGYAFLLLITVWWALKMLRGNWRSITLTTALLVGCLWEQSIHISLWWHPQSRPASYFTQLSPPSHFLQNYLPTQNRIYSSIAGGFILDLPRAEPANISARRGFHDAAGYEPLMSERYSKAFGSGWSFYTPAFSSPLDRQLLSPRWQVLDLLNVRFLAEFAAHPDSFTEIEGVRFAAGDTNVDLRPGASAVFAGVGTAVDSLSLVTTLANSGHLAQGEIAARIVIHTSGGRVIERELKAGVDSAEWAHERQDVKPLIRHSLARIFDSRPGDDQNSFPSHRYWTRIDLGGKTLVDRVEITCVSETASVGIWKATLYDTTGREAYLLPQRLPEQWRKVYDHDNVRIYENKRMLPRLWLVPRAKAVSAEESLRSIRGESKEDFNPRDLALLELPGNVRVDPPQGEKAIDGEAHYVSYEPNRLVIETAADKPSVLVLSEAFYPGWKATIDGQPTTIYTANYLLRGLILPQGKHRVEMIYEAPEARLGALISAASIAVIGVGFVIARRRGRKRD